MISHVLCSVYFFFFKSCKGNLCSAPVCLPLACREQMDEILAKMPTYLNKVSFFLCWSWTSLTWMTHLLHIAVEILEQKVKLD